MAEVVLHDYWRSTASYRVRIALGLAGIEYDSVPVDLVAGAQRSPDHLARNPQGLVPVLEIDGHRLTQSLAIVEYLNETQGLGLLPEDVAERARVRALAHATAVDIHPVCNLAVAAYATMISESATARQDWMHRFIAPGLAAVETMLGGIEQRPYAAGAAVSLADLCLIPQLYNAHRWGVSLDALPRIRGVEVACADIPAFRAAYPAEPL